MIINEKQIKKQNIITVVVVAVLCIVLVIFVTAVRPDFPYYWSIAAEVVCGAILVISLGLCINEETRIYGILYAALTSLTPLFSIIIGSVTGNPVTISVLLPSYGVGILIGGTYTLVNLTRGHTEKLGKALKNTLALFIAIIAAIIIVYGILLPLCTQLMYAGVPTNIDLNDILPYIISVGCLIALLIIFNMFILNKNIGVDGSGVFVIGPPGSGKTYFAIGLYNHFVDNECVSPYNIPVLDIKSSNPNEHVLTLEGLYNMLIQGKGISSTMRGQLLPYKFGMKKLKFIPTTWTIMDYPGENYTSLCKDDYDMAMNYVMEKTKWSKVRIEDEAKTLELIRSIQKLDGKDSKLYDYVVTVIMYVHFINAGKIIFIIDGDQLKNEWLERYPNDIINGANTGGEKRVDINRLFSDYTRIIMNWRRDKPNTFKEIEKLYEKRKKLYDMDDSDYNLKRERKLENINAKISELESNSEFGKKIAFVVSKTDTLTSSCRPLNNIIKSAPCMDTCLDYDLSMIESNKEGIRNLESRLYDELNSNNYANFTNCMNTISNEKNIPIYFIAASIDSQTTNNGQPCKNVNRGLNLFGFSEIEKFGK